VSSTPPVPPTPVNAAPANAAAPDARRVTAVVGVLSLAVFMSSLDLFIVNLAFPSIAKQYPGTSLSSLSWVLNAYTIVFAAVLVPAGRWADRIGRRRALVAGLAAFSVGSLLCGVAPGVAALIAARVIQAAGAGVMVPASLSLLLAAVPAPARAKALGTWSALAALGAALGPVIGGSLVEINWRWVFWVNLPVGLAAMILAVRVVPESKDERASGRPDLIGAGLLAAAVGLVALALVKAPGWGWGSVGFIGLMAASLACGTAMVMRSRRHHSPSNSNCFAPGLSAARSAPRSCTTPVSALSCSARSSSSPACGTTPPCWPAWPSRPGRSWSCRSPASPRRAWPPGSAAPAGSR
jgi:MFS family permease